MVVVLITGANRGLGLAFVKRFAALPNHTVLAAARQPDDFPKTSIDVLGAGSSVSVLEYDAGDMSSAAAMMEQAKAKHGIDRIDIVVANAGVMPPYMPVNDVPISDAEETFRVNVLGPLALFQACRHLMRSGAKFIFTSSGTSVISREPERPDVAYGISKSSINHLARYAHFENPDLTIWAMSPGHVQTDMGMRGAEQSGMDKAPFTVEQSIDGQMKIISEATRNNYSGKHIRFNGEIQEW